MYSQVQQKCLRELGVVPLELRDAYSIDKVTEQGETPALCSNAKATASDWQAFGVAWLADIQVLFPNLKCNHNQLWLSEVVQWQLFAGATTQISPEQIITDIPTNLSVQDKRQIWAHLQSILAK